jgi:hypothetical protein
MCPNNEVLIAEAYAKAFPKATPYEQLSPSGQREARGYFESRGVIFNPRFGVTGRIGGYAALRNFTLAADELKEAEGPEAETEEFPSASNAPPPKSAEDPARDMAAKRDLAELQKHWPPVEDERPNANTDRNDILDKAITILEPYAKMAAKQHLGTHLSEEDAEEIAHDALAAWKAKVLRRVQQIRNGETNTKGERLPDAFVGEKLGTHTKRNLIADIGRFVFNVGRTREKTAAGRATIAPMEPLASEHEGERGEDEPPIGAVAKTEVTPETEITGPEQTQDINRMFRTLSRDLRRSASTDAADLLDAILSTNSISDRELARELGWPRRKIRDVRTVLSTYVKHRAKTNPELRRYTRVFGEAAERLCEKYAVLNLLLSSNFLPTQASKSLSRIYEKFENRAEVEKCNRMKLQEWDEFRGYEDEPGYEEEETAERHLLPGELTRSGAHRVETVFNVFRPDDTVEKKFDSLEHALAYTRNKEDYTIGSEAAGSPRGYLGAMWDNEGRKLKWNRDRGSWVPGEEEEGF